MLVHKAIDGKRFNLVVVLDDLCLLEEVLQRGVGVVYIHPLILHIELGREFERAVDRELDPRPVLMRDQSVEETVDILLDIIAKVHAAADCSFPSIFLGRNISNECAGETWVHTRPLS